MLGNKEECLELPDYHALQPHLLFQVVEGGAENAEVQSTKCKNSPCKTEFL